MNDIELLKEMLKLIGEANQNVTLAEACYIIVDRMKPEEEPKAEPKKETKRGRKAFDMGKLKALLDGGWSVPNIAEEMKVSDQTIYNKMKQIKEQEHEHRTSKGDIRTDI